MQMSDVKVNEGLLVIDKSPGPTSFDVVREVRRIAGGEKVGHSGSLDPFASGVLVLMLGRATRLSQVLTETDKVYRARVLLGTATDTMDLTGQVTGTEPVPSLCSQDIERVLRGLEGTWEQVPPVYSAKKVNGVRLYKLARQDIRIKLAPIPVKLHQLKLLAFESPFIDLQVHCSKGTYVRSLAGEIGQRLGTVAHLYELRRLACGPFSIDESVTLADLKNNAPDCLKKGYGNYLRYLRGQGRALELQ